MKSAIVENRLTHIIDSAETIFFEKGFSKTTISDICKVADCSRTTLYSHFESKENIYLAVVNKSFNKFLNYFINLTIEESSGLGQLLELAQGYIDFAKQWPKNYEMVLDFYSILKNIGNDKLRSDADVQLSKCSYFAEAKNNADMPSSFLIKVIEKGQNDGSINSRQSADILFLNVWAYLLGSTNLFNFSNSRKNIEILGVKLVESEKNTLAVIEKILS